MNERGEFNKKSEEILDFVNTYGVLSYELLEKFFPRCKSNINYLIKRERLHKSTDEIYIGADREPIPDKCLIAALGVLADIFAKVESHTRAMHPAQISLITHSCDFYEIIYVGYGMEAMITASYQSQLAAKQRLENYEDTTKRMIIVEDKNQMARLQISGITRFILIQPDGSLSYFKA